jgi:Tfp pilus assembly protein FimT
VVHAERGLNLLKLLVIVGILATIVMCAVPDFVAWRKQAAYRQVARELVGVMRQARSLAITRNLEERVEIEVQKRRYRLMEGDRSTHSTAFATTVLDWVNLPGEVALMRNLACDNENDRFLEFNPNGTAQSGYVCVVEAASPDACHYKVGVASSTCGCAVVRME